MNNRRSADKTSAGTPKAPQPDGRRSRLTVLGAVFSKWTEAAEWAWEQDRRRAGEQRRFAASRALLDLERLWSLPSSTPVALVADDPEQFRRP